MLSSKSLRIGNWVRTKQSKKEFKIKEIGSSIFSIIASQYEGIPITEEWLEKFGFKLFKRKAYLFQNYTLDLDGNFCIMNHKLSSNIKYVHDLQNLYFALTNRELEIKKDE